MGENGWRILTENLHERGTFGHGNSVDAEQISIPLIVRLPAALGMRGRRGDEVGVIDLMPTLLDILGVPGPPGMAGRNLFWCPYCQPPGSGR